MRGPCNTAFEMIHCVRVRVNGCTLACVRPCTLRCRPAAASAAKPAERGGGWGRRYAPQCGVRGRGVTRPENFCRGCNTKIVIFAVGEARFEHNESRVRNCTNYIIIACTSRDAKLLTPNTNHAHCFPFPSPLFPSPSTSAAARVARRGGGPSLVLARGEAGPNAQG